MQYNAKLSISTSVSISGRNMPNRAAGKSTRPSSALTALKPRTHSEAPCEVVKLLPMIKYAIH